ncbi:hypothetical protein C1H46_025235 [Malus baccata]|uniref:Uncharacterized protein n=1 Tax=Malus baccata TaxID=106549 RepID=A0A540LRR8_MALBA|nr:hypothetical protein C1H46_025235 [Malus baccata]
MAAVVVRSTKAEQLDFLHLRYQLKDRIRMKKSGGSAAAHFCSVSSTADDNKKKLPFDNFGSFFGPSERVMTNRVREERKDFMPELKKLASRVLNFSDKAKASVKSPAPLSTAMKCKIIESRVTPFCNRTVQKFQSLQKEESLKKLAKPNPPRQSLNLLRQGKAWSKQSKCSVKPKPEQKKSVSKYPIKYRVEELSKDVIGKS